MNQRTFWLGLAVLLVVAFACFAYPMYVIRPFVAQEAGQLAAALAVRAWGPLVALIAAISSLALVTMFWKQNPNRRKRAGAVSVFLLTAGFAALSRVNVYEQMFHPAPGAGFIAASQAKVDGDDMVLAIAVGGEARAYPIRTMGYHHIINDRVGNVPVVSTY